MAPKMGQNARRLASIGPRARESGIDIIIPWGPLPAPWGVVGLGGWVGAWDMQRGFIRLEKGDLWMGKKADDRKSISMRYIRPRECPWVVPVGLNAIEISPRCLPGPLIDEAIPIQYSLDIYDHRIPLESNFYANLWDEKRL